MNEPATKSWFTADNFLTVIYVLVSIAGIFSGVLGGSHLLVIAGVGVLTWRLGKILPKVFSNDIWKMFEERLGKRASVAPMVYAGLLAFGIACVMVGDLLDGAPRFLFYLVGAAVGIFGFVSLIQLLFRLLAARAETLVSQLAPGVRHSYIAGAAILILAGFGWVLYANLT